MKTEGEITGAMERLGISREAAQTVDYAGDGVYVWGDGFGLWLGTLEGQRVYLEPLVFKSVTDIRERLIKEGCIHAT